MSKTVDLTDDNLVDFMKIECIILNIVENSRLVCFTFEKTELATVWSPIIETTRRVPV